MHRALPPFLVAIVVLAGVSPAVGGHAALAGSPAAQGDGPAETPGAMTTPAALAPVVGTSPNTTRVLTLDSISASAFETADSSVTNALKAESSRVETTMWLYATQTELDRAEEPEARERILLDLTDRLDARVDALEAREEQARSRFIAGEIGPKRYVTVLGEVNVEATDVTNVLAQIDQLSARNSNIQDRVNDLMADTTRLTGPIKDRLGDAVLGAGRTDTFFVGVSANGVTLSMLRDGTYVRETVRTDARDDTVGGVDLDAAQTRIAELYPWAWVNNGGVSIRSIGQDVFRFQLSHDHGSLDSLLDTSSRNVYREIQTKSLSGLPTRVGYTTSANNTTLQVSDSYAGGPLQVQVLNATGAPVPATVSVNETVVGQTDGGPVWAISPGGTFNVTATRGDVDLRVSVTAG